MKAYQVIDSPEKWTRKAHARCKHGKECDPCSKAAISWCAIGAIEKAYPYNKQHEIVQFLSGEINQWITAWNDSSDWETVYNKLKELDI